MTDPLQLLQMPEIGLLVSAGGPLMLVAWVSIGRPCWSPLGLHKLALLLVLC